ncbi:hypothetical protein ACHAWF_005928 [Thalassiosira exigua]
MLAHGCDDVCLKAVAILPKVGGSLSIVGSTLMLRDIVKKWKSITLTVEVLSHITVANLFIAFWECFLSTWMVPRDSPAFGAAGNRATCEVQGFITLLMFVVLEVSYTILAVLYYIIVAQGWSEQKTQRRKIRFLFLGLPVVVALALAVPPLFLGTYNFTGWFSCSLEEYPLNCDVDPNIECERGERARKIQGWMFVGVLVSTIIILVSMTLLVRTIVAQEKKGDKYLNPGQQKKRELSDKAFWQSVRYFSVFFISNLPFYIFAIYDVTSGVPPVWIALIYAIFWPLFGVFNSFVYFRPRYLSYRKKNADKSWMDGICSVLEIDLRSSHWRMTESVPPRISELNDEEEDDLSSLLFQKNGEREGTDDRSGGV